MSLTTSCVNNYIGALVEYHGNLRATEGEQVISTRTSYWPASPAYCPPDISDLKAHMSMWLLLSLAVVFGYFAYDAWKLSVPAKDVPYSLTAEGLGQDVAHVPLHEQERRKSWNTRYGLGDLGQSVWLWGILSLACAAGALWS